ncbi:MAG: PadR family transcriptional regulator [Candidatus Aenigmarchaeota archaeon]|nr:PadR family transcriptional regulator [Candidatus Aenigmarchaeota archaeon]
MEKKDDRDILNLIDSKIAKGILPIALLQIIKVKKSVHAYDIVKVIHRGFQEYKQEVCDDSEAGFDISRALIYSTLQKLEDDSFVKTSWVNQDLSGTPSKKNYELTKNGALYLKHAKKRITDVVGLIFEYRGDSKYNLARLRNENSMD